MNEQTAIAQMTENTIRFLGNADFTITTFDSEYLQLRTASKENADQVAKTWSKLGKIARNERRENFYVGVRFS